MPEAYEKFAEYYDRMYEGFTNHKLDCDFLEEAWKGEMEVKRVLDIACGTGNHTIELSSRGYDVVGLDKSPAMLSRAWKKASLAGADSVFVQQDMKRLDVDGKFDATICMFGGFGYLHTDEDIREFLNKTGASLSDSAFFIFEFWNEGGVIPNHRSWLKSEKEEDTLLRISESRIDDELKLAEITMEFLLYKGKRIMDQFEEKHTMRLHTEDGLRKLLDDGGFRLEKLYNFDKKQGKPTEFKENAFQTLAVARRKV